MLKIVFYCHDSIDNIRSMEYYRQDIEALKVLGHEVVVCNRYRDIPLWFDVMYVWWWTYALVPVVFARMLRRPSLVTGVYNFRFENKSHGADYFGRPWHQRLLIRLATKLTNANLFVSEREFNEVPRYFKLNLAYYYPCAVGEEYFAVNQSLEPRSGLLNIAWSGTENLKRKGVWDILDAMRLLKERGVAVSLTLVGKRGDAYLELQQRIAELGLEDNVQAVGEVTAHEKLNLFARAKLYLQPSYFEGFGLATAEAMAAGCCVITCDVGEVRNVVGDCGLYIQPGQPNELAYAVQTLLADQEAVDKLNRKATQRMKEFFSFSRKTATLRTVLHEIT
jgi:glycosyltransferase involved in cell wall biosynthesis